MEGEYRLTHILKDLTEKKVKSEGGGLEGVLGLHLGVWKESHDC